MGGLSGDGVVGLSWIAAICIACERSPAKDEVFTGEFADGRALQELAKSEVHNFVESDAEVGEIALSALNADGVGLVSWLVWNFFSVQEKVDMAYRPTYLGTGQITCSGSSGTAKAHCCSSRPDDSSCTSSQN